MLPSNKKNILILVDWFEPGYKAGGPIQSCKNFVKAFHNDHNLYIITSDRDMGDTAPYKSIEADQWLKYDENVNIYYTSNNQLSFSLTRKLISQIRPDYILLNNMFSIRFTIIPLFLKLFKKISANVILSPRGMLQDGAMHFKTYKKKLFLKVLEILKIPQQITFHATDEQEKEDILKYFPAVKKLFVADNFGPIKEAQWLSVKKVPGELKLVFLSRISPKKNLLFLLRLFSDYMFNAKINITIAGGIEDEVYWEQCKAVIKKLPSNIDVQYMGAIENDKIYELYSHYHAFVLPTLGENFGHAIFEALLAGKPIIISDKTPWKNLSEKCIGYDISLAQPVAFKEAIQHFVSWNQEEYDRWSKSAWSFATNYRKVSDIKAKYEQVFK